MNAPQKCHHYDQMALAARIGAEVEMFLMSDLRCVPDLFERRSERLTVFVELLQAGGLASCICGHCAKQNQKARVA